MQHNIVMPRLGVNDNFITLTQWIVKNGSKVKKGEKIAIIESTKETSDIVADRTGYIEFKVQEGQDVDVNDVIAVINEERFEAIEKEPDFLDQYKITEKAKILIDEYHIDISQLPNDRLIKEKDILKLVNKPYEIAEVKSNQILLYGGGGFGKIAVDILKKNPEWQIYGIIDINYPSKTNVLDIPVIGTNENLVQLLEEGYRRIFNAIGFKNKVHWRKPPFEMLQEMGFEFFNVIHKTSIIEQSAKLGQSNLICAGAIIGTDARIGNNCIINAGSIISHDCIISDHCHIASGAVLAGNVIVGENTLVGQNCTIYSDVKIGKNVVIQNGCHIFKDVKDGEIILIGERN